MSDGPPRPPLSRPIAYHQYHPGHTPASAVVVAYVLIALTFVHRTATARTGRLEPLPRELAATLASPGATAGLAAAALFVLLAVAVAGRFLATVPLARTRPITTGLLLLLVGNHALFAFVGAQYDWEVTWYLFRVTGLERASPGWLFAPVSHSSVRHLLVNAAGLTVFASILEPRLRRGQFLALLIVGGFGSMASQAAYYTAHGINAGALGASGLVRALVVFTGVLFTARWLRERDRRSRWLLVGAGCLLVGLASMALDLHSPESLFIEHRVAVTVHVAGGLLGGACALVYLTIASDHPPTASDHPTTGSDHPPSAPGPSVGD